MPPSKASLMRLAKQVVWGKCLPRSSLEGGQSSVPRFQQRSLSCAVRQTQPPGHCCSFGERDPKRLGLGALGPKGLTSISGPTGRPPAVH